MKVDKARFDKANLSGSDLSAALRLTQVQLNIACGDSETKLPKSLVLAPCKAS